MYGTNPTDQLYLAVLAKQIGEGLEQQIEGFVREHPGTKLVIIDTLQKVRSGKSAARNEYAADYEAMGPLKQLADQLGICIMMVHHTRKQDADDPFDTVSGTNGLHGSVDGTFLFKRSHGQTPRTGTIDVTGRDVAEHHYRRRSSLFQRVTGTIIKGFLCGVLSADNRGSTPMPPRRAQCAFDGFAVKSAFAFTFGKSNKTPLRGERW